MPFYYGCLATCYSLAAIYGSLVPFRFVWPDGGFLQAADAAFFRNSLGAVSAFDAAANVALFVPLGFLWSGAALFSGSTVRRAVVSAGLIAAAALLSAGIEWLQRGLPARTTSPVDILAETVGAGLGCALWWRFGPRLSIWLAQRQATTARSRQWNWLLQAYLAVVSVAWLLPLDLTCRPGELAAKARSERTELRPFSGMTTQRALRIGLTAALFLPIGILLATAAMESRGGVRSEKDCRWAIVGLTCLLAMGQLLVYSRTTDVLEIAAVAFGMAGGAAIARRFWPGIAPNSGRHSAWAWPFRFNPVSGGNELPPAVSTWKAGWIVYAVIVVFASLWVICQPWITSPGDMLLTGRVAPNWQPTWPFQAYWAALLLLLILVPRWPFVGPIVFVLLSYSGPALGHISASYFRAIGGHELSVLLSLVGLAIAGQRGSFARIRASWILWLVTLYAGWGLISAANMLFDGRAWNPDVTQQCFRLLLCAAAAWMAAWALGSQRGDYLLALSLGLGVVIPGVFFPEAVYRNHALTTIVAIALPLALFALAHAPHIAIQITLSLALLKFAGMLHAGESRSAVGGALAGLIVYAALSKYRLWLAAAAVPSFIVAQWLLFDGRLTQRFKSIWLQEEGWDTGRLGIWHHAWTVFQQFPVFGQGPGMATSTGHGDGAHSSYLAALSETGAIGLALYLMVWIATLALLALTIGRGSTAHSTSLAKVLAAATVTQLVAGLGYSFNALPLAFLIAGWSVALAASTSRRSTASLLALSRSP